MSSDSWAIVSIILFTVSLLSIILFFFSRKVLLRKAGFVAGIICFIVSISAFVFSKNQASLINNNSYAVVFESAIVKSSPSDESTNLFEINEGLKVEIKDSVNSWVNIRLSDGKEGWMQVKNVKKL
jgi:uncharacterized protein YgiM (DUF1202 family)